MEKNPRFDDLAATAVFVAAAMEAADLRRRGANWYDLVEGEGGRRWRERYRNDPKMLARASLICQPESETDVEKLLRLPGLDPSVNGLGGFVSRVFAAAERAEHDPLFRRGMRPILDGTWAACERHLADTCAVRQEHNQDGAGRGISPGEYAVVLVMMRTKLEQVLDEAEARES